MFSVFCVRRGLCVMPLCFALACAADAAPATVTSIALAAAGSGGQPADVTGCSLEYASCLAQSPLGVVRCTEAAESCGLFAAASAGAGGASVSTSPTCALRLAECVVRDPFRAQACQRMLCDAPTPH